MPERSITVRRTVPAPADEIFDWLVRPANHRHLDTSGMLRGAPESARIGAVGTTFTMDMHNDDKGDHQVENHVVVHEPGRALGWAPGEPGQEPAGHTWTWRLAPDGDHATVVTQTYDWSRFSHLDALEYLPVIDRDGLERSLELLARAVER